jgi:DNA-binding beta-propeller fold protein YncE
MGWRRAIVLACSLSASCHGGWVIARYRMNVLVGAVCALAVAALPSAAGAAGSAYVVNYISDNAFQYDIGPGGLLAPKTSPTVAAGNGAYSVAVNPDGRSVYVADYDANVVSQFDARRATDALPTRSSGTMPTGCPPDGARVASSPGW